jgi:hypothetical protein
MAKQIMNETQLVKIVEAATRDALNTILNEDVGLNTIRQSFKSGIKGDKWMDEKGGSPAKNYIKKGNGTDWNNFEDDRDTFNRLSKATDVQSRNFKKKQSRTPNDHNGIADAHSKFMNTKAERDAAAGDAVGSRPGLVGKAQRAANVGAYRVGKALKGAKDSATKFMHNNIGLEENK